jgi:hypothetical protein
MPALALDKQQKFLFNVSNGANCLLHFTGRWKGFEKYCRCLQNSAG